MNFADIKQQLNNNDQTNVVDSLLFVRKKTIKKLLIFTPLVLVFALLSIIFYNKQFNDYYFNQKIYIIITSLIAVFYAVLLLVEVIRSIYYIYKDSKDLKKLKTNYFIYNLLENFFSYVNVLIIVMFLFVMVITTATVRMTSMKNTLDEGDRLLIYHMTHNYDDGDIVIIAYHDYEEKHRINGDVIVKRIVAKPGDTIEIKFELINGSRTQVLYVNDKKVEDYRINSYTLLTDKNGNDYYKENEPIVLGEDLYIVLGDNRKDSTDSRQFGLISKEDILGKAFFRLYPFSKIKSLGGSANE